MTPSPFRWVVISVLILATALNYLDRQLLAALAPSLKSEFHLSNEQYGLVLLAFSLAYAAAAPAAGLVIDRIGLTAGMSLAVAGWSTAGMLTGLVASFPALLACRMHGAEHTPLGALAGNGALAAGGRQAPHQHSSSAAAGSAKYTPPLYTPTPE